MWVLCWAWLGEIRFGQISGAFLRVLENQVSAIPNIRESLGFNPLSWESYIVTRPTLHPKIVLLCGFTGSTLLSLCLFSLVWHATGGPKWMTWSATSVEIALSLVTLWLALKIRKHGKEAGREW
jgi:hypothetical protein